MKGEKEYKQTEIEKDGERENVNDAMKDWRNTHKKDLRKLKKSQDDPKMAWKPIKMLRIIRKK